MKSKILTSEHSQIDILLMKQNKFFTIGIRNNISPCKSESKVESLVKQDSTEYSKSDDIPETEKTQSILSSEEHKSCMQETPENEPNPEEGYSLDLSNEINNFISLVNGFRNKDLGEKITVDVVSI